MGITNLGEGGWHDVCKSVGGSVSQSASGAYSGFECGMLGLHIGAIGQADEDAIRGGNFFGAGSVGAKEISSAAGVIDGSGLGGGNYRVESKIVENNFLISFSALFFSWAGFFGSAKTLGFGGAFLMASGRSGAFAAGVLAGIPAGPTVVTFDPADVRLGSRVGVA